MKDLDSHVVSDALGLLPSGVYLMTAGHDGQRSGMLVRSVSQCSDEPSLICVAARKGHKIDPLIRDSRSFAIGLVSPTDKLIRRRFMHTDTAPVERPIIGDDDPYDALETGVLETGSPILMRCPTWFDCEVMRRVDLEAQSELFVGQIVAVLHNGERVKIDPISETD